MASRSVSATRRWSDYSCLYIRREKLLITYLSKYYNTCFYSFLREKACGKTNKGFVWHQLPFRKQSTWRTYGLKRWIITLTCLEERSTLGDWLKQRISCKISNSLLSFLTFLCCVLCSCVHPRCCPTCHEVSLSLCGESPLPPPHPKPVGSLKGQSDCAAETKHPKKISKSQHGN